MRVRVTTTALGITAALLTVSACSPETTATEPDTASSAPAREPSRADQRTPLSSAALRVRLLDEGDLGSGYVRQPQRPDQHVDVTVVGCPALSKLGGDPATRGSLSFPHKAKVTFTYARKSSSKVAEELYSDSADKLSDGIGKIFDAMTDCPTYQVVSGGTTIDMTSQKAAAPHQLGDEQWSQLMTFSTGWRSTLVKQTAIRDGNVLLILSGSPALVDRHLHTAVFKATSTG